MTARRHIEGAPAAMAELRLPYPPSANTLFVNVPGKGRVKSKRYNAWIQRAWVETVPPPPRIEGPVSIVYQLTPPDKRKRDASNAIKATEDFLVRRGVIEDDSLVETYVVRWWRKGEPGVHVMVMPFPTAVEAAA